MEKSECKRILEINGDKCKCGGKWEITYEVWFDGEKLHYLKCNKCGESFDG